MALATTSNYWANRLPEEALANEGTTPPSIKEVCRKIEQLASLEDNWDSYGASRPTRHALTGALRWAYDLFTESTPTPDVFPLPNGNVQLEWSQGQMDIEIEIISISTCKAIIDDLLNDEEPQEQMFTYDLNTLATAMKELSDRSKTGHNAGLKIVH